MDVSNYNLIPTHMMQQMKDYAEKGIPVGSFLAAVIKNDLKGACECADDRNITIIPVYVNWFYNHAPMPCWGSEENYFRWLDEHQAARAKKIKLWAVSDSPDACLYRIVEQTAFMSMLEYDMADGRVAKAGWIDTSSLREATKEQIDNYNSLFAKKG